MENETNKPIRTFRQGAIGASVWKRNGKSGVFYEFTISRSYKKNDEDAGYSQCFREYNEEALMDVIHQAAGFVRERNESKERHAA